ncbi:hypothetical protein AGMMS4956_00720 [Bacteroidia bacterium]|nr:hypothetical protein AGMMS4956_00720 [Bacteroidia bacterium]
MKKFLFPCVVLFALTSCNDEKKEAAVLTVLPRLVEAPAAGDTVDIAVTSTVDWTVTSANTAWCTVAPASGSNDGTFQVTVLDNPNTTTRETTITVAGGGLEQTIPVEQEARTLVLTEEAMLGDWAVTEQYSGSDGLDYVIGLYIMFTNNDNALIFMNPTDPNVSTPGTWSIAGNVLTISGELGNLIFEVSETSTPEGTWLKCNLIHALLLPEGGLLCKFEKVVND